MSSSTSNSNSKHTIEPSIHKDECAAYAPYDEQQQQPTQQAQAHQAHSRAQQAQAQQAQAQQGKYYAIGFGSNYFHQFGNSAIPLQDIFAHVHPNALLNLNLNMNASFADEGGGTTTASSTDGSISQDPISMTCMDDNSNSNANSLIHDACNAMATSSSEQESGAGAGTGIGVAGTSSSSPSLLPSSSSILPKASYIFPLHPDQNKAGTGLGGGANNSSSSSSSADHNATEHKHPHMRKLRGFLRRKRNKKKNNGSTEEAASGSMAMSGHGGGTAAAASNNPIMNTTDPNASQSSSGTNANATTNAMNSANPYVDLPYASNANPVLKMDAGMTHVAVVNEKGIYMSGTLHGIIHPTPTLKGARVPLKCTQIACGRRHTLALFEGKLVMSWGSGYFGQLGHGIDRVYCEHPTVMERLMPRYLGGDIVSIAAGGMQSAAIICSDPNMTSRWGEFVGNGGGAGGADRYKLKDIETRVFRWGSNRHGQCAVEGGKCNVVPYPTPMIDVFNPETGKKVSFLSLALGKSHAVGLTHQGELYSWGSTSAGRCGHGDRNADGTVLKSALKMRNGVSLPKRIEALKNVRIVQIACGDLHTLALSGSGRVFSWGNNSSGQLGVGHTMHLLSPRLIVDLEFGQGSKGFAKGELSQAAETPTKGSGNGGSETENGTDSMGSPMLKGKGIGAMLSHIHYPSTPQKKTTQQRERPVGVDRKPPSIVAIHAAGSYSAAVSSSGDLYTWGCGDGDQLGHVLPSIRAPLQCMESRPTPTVPRSNPASRIRDIDTFDSRLNVLLPRRVECLRQIGVKVKDLSTSPNFMLAICESLDKFEMDDYEGYMMGRTLFELENERREKGLDRIRLLRTQKASPSCMSPDGNGTIS